jgi:hypothetical protein
MLVIARWNCTLNLMLMMTAAGLNMAVSEVPPAKAMGSSKMLFKPIPLSMRSALEQSRLEYTPKVTHLLRTEPFL